MLLAKHRQTTEYGRKLFQNADQLALTSQPGVLFGLISTICFFAPIDQRKHIYSAKRNSALRGDVETWPAYIETLVREWSTFNLAVRCALCAHKQAV